MIIGNKILLIINKQYVFRSSIETDQSLPIQINDVFFVLCISSLWFHNLNVNDVSVKRNMLFEHKALERP